MLRQRLVLSLTGRPAAGWHGTNLIGPARVLDGDTMTVAGEPVRLHGIDAPELDQTYWINGSERNCGAMALAALEALTAGIWLRCEAIERDCYGRLVAKCFSPNGVDVGRRLVAAGWALAFRRYSLDYVAAEDEAREAFRGLWRGSFVKPWDWRASLARQGRNAGLSPRDADLLPTTDPASWSAAPTAAAAAQPCPSARSRRRPRSGKPRRNGKW